MKQIYDLVLVISVESQSSPKQIVETIQEFTYAADSTYKIILADDSQKGTGWIVQKTFPDIDVIKTPITYGKSSGLYVSLSFAFIHALENFRFTAILSLVTNCHFDMNNTREALTLLKNNSTGIAGELACKSVPSLINLQLSKPKPKQLISTWKFITRPFSSFALNNLYKNAGKNNYVKDENISTSSFFVSETCLVLLRKAGLLPNMRLQYVDTGEINLFALLAKSVGMDIGILNVPGRGSERERSILNERTRDGRIIMHSAPFWKNADEEEKRAYYNEKENQ